VFAAAEHLAQKPPQALAIARRLVKPDPEIRWSPGCARKAELFANQLKSAEALAAFQAFMARKK
jgi:enoyl-CoA hydratase/carnithine racemase